MSSTRIGKRPCSSGIRSAGFGRVERPGRDEQDVVGLHRPVLGVDGGAFDDRQQVALHALPRHVRAVAGLRAADLVDLVEEDDALVLDALDRLLGDRGAVDERFGLLLDQDLAGFLDRESAAAGRPWA